MKKFLIVLSVIVLIAALGVGGYFVTLNIYKNIALEKLILIFLL